MQAKYSIKKVEETLLSTDTITKTIRIAKKRWSTMCHCCSIPDFGWRAYKPVFGILVIQPLYQNCGMAEDHRAPKTASFLQPEPEILN